MKKTIFLVYAFSLTFLLTAQLQPVLKNKRGINILPEKGEYSFGISAAPFINYLGSIATGNNNTPNAQLLFDQTFFGKYMITNQKAYRGSLRLGFINDNIKSKEKNVNIGAEPNTEVVNSIKTSSTNIRMSFGIENRRGNNRLQGIWGFEPYIGYKSGETKSYQYGNSITSFNMDTTRLTKARVGNQFVVGVRAFIGAELFIAPKLSIGFDLGYGPQFQFKSGDYLTHENYTLSTNEISSKKTYLFESQSTFMMDSDFFNSNFRVNFYF
jgi:hypothetical protein